MKKGRMKKLLALVLCFLLIFSLVENVGYQPIAEEVLLASASDAELTEAVGSTEDTEGVEGTEGQGLSDLQESIVNGGVLGGAPIAVAQEVTEEVSPENEIMPIAEYEENGFTVSNFEIKVNGTPIQEGQELKNGEEVSIYFDWALADNAHGTRFSFEISASGIVIEDARGPLEDQTTGETVGYWYIEDGVLYVELDEEYVQQSSINGQGRFDGKISVEAEGDETEWEGSFEVGDTTTPKVTVDVYPDESYIDVKKVADGPAQESNGKLVQKFKVTLQALQGDVTLQSIKDQMGEGLEIVPGSITVKMGDTSYTPTSLDDLSNWLNDKKLTNNKIVEIEYSVYVDDEVYGSDMYYHPEYDNTFSADYTSDWENSQSRNNSASVDVKRPTVNKEGRLTNDNTQVEWTITINLGDLDWSNITSIVDTLDETFLELPEGITLTDLKNAQWNGPDDNGNYTFTFVTDIKEEELDSSFSKTLKNKVDVDFKYKDSEFTQSKEATVTLEAGKLLEKEFVDYNAENHELTWKITIHVPELTEGTNGEATISNVVLKDILGGYGENHNHTVVKNKILLNGTPITDDSGELTDYGKEWIDEICFGKEGGNNYDGNYDGISWINFKDEKIKSVAGSDIVLTIVTKATEDSVTAQTANYYNKAMLEYKDIYEQSKNGEADASYTIVNSVSKTGKQVDIFYDNETYKRNVAEYTVTLDLLSLEGFGVDKKLVLKDSLPLNMMYDTSFEAQVTYETNFGSYFSQQTINGAPTLNVDASTYQNGERQAVEFSIVVNQALFDQIETWKNWGNLDNVFIHITYRTKIAPEYEKDFLEKGEIEKFTNNVTATFDGKGVGEASTSVDMEPSQVVLKGGVYDPSTSTNTVSYSIIVNPEKADLSPGSDFIQATDEMESALLFDKETLKVSRYDGTGDPFTDDENWTLLGAGEHYSYTYKDGVITFKLPDNAALKITYDCKINLYNGAEKSDDNDRLTKENSRNSFTLQGFESGKTKSEKIFTENLSSANVTSNAELGAVTIYKFWTDGDQMVALNGSVFALYQCNTKVEDGVTVVDSIQEKVYKGHDSITLNNGKTLVNDLEYQNVYALVEISADEGFSTGNVYYFGVYNTKLEDTPKLADYIDKFFSAGIVYYENFEGESLSIEAQKTLNGSTDNLEEDQFTFIIEKGTLTNLETGEFNGETIDTVKNSEDGSVKFSPFSYGDDDINQTYHYKISEVPGEEDGITYDKSYYIVDVTVSKPADEMMLSVEVTKYVWDEAEGKYKQADGEWDTDSITFNNTTKVAEGTLVLKKTITGDILSDSSKLNDIIKSIEFTIKNSDGTVNKTIKLDDGDFPKDSSGANAWTATIDELPVGTYTITETVTTADGYVRSTSYTVTVQEEQKDGGTGLVAGNIEIEDGKITTVEFTNKYKEASLSLEAEKTLNGKTGGLQADQFEFVIEKVKDVNETTGSCTVITATAEKPYSQTVKNLANGDVKFDTINYNDGDIGTTYYYRISEKKGEETDITYDETFYIVKVTVEETGVTHTITKYVKDGAGFKKDESFNDSTISFDNKKELAASISVEASKTWLGWNGQPKTLAGNEFEFTLQQVAEDAANAGNVTSGTSLTAKNDVNGKITFVIPYAEDDAANSPYYYKISEKAGSESNVNYDDSFYIVTVTITKAEGSSGSDELTTAITKVTKYVKDETGYKKDETYVWSVGTAIDFENTTSIDDTSISLKALKVLHDGADTPTFAAGKFNFSLQEVELREGQYTVIQDGTTRTASNDASGNITFAGITYTEDDAGKTYYYKISEDGGSDSNIIYDDSYYIVAVTITKVAGTSGNGELQLTTTVTKYVNNGSDVFIEDASKTWTVNNMQFDNKVAVKDGSLSLEASKTLIGKNGQNVTLTAGQFSFKLQQVTVTNESTGATTDMTPGESQTKTNATNGKVVFDDITYTKADIGQTYYYKISEVIPADTNYAYDKSFYIVEVKVTENTTKNCAEATVTKVTKYVLDSDGINHTKASGSYTANNISFENKEYYAQETIMLRKTVKGVQSMAGYGNKFSFKLTGVRDDNDSSKAVDLPVAYNDAQGNVKFTLPAYTGDDIGHTYTYTITEVAGTDATFKYDSTKYYVTVRITAPNSELETEIHYYKGSTDPGNEITSSLPTVDIALPYENRLAAKGDVSIPGTKYLNDGEPGNNTFDFEIYKVVDGSSDELIDTVSSSNPDGKFAFTLSYEDEDLTGTDDERTTTYTYKVKEKKPTNGLPGYEYDENEFTVTVTLKDKGDGTISSTVSYADKSGAAREIAFYNTSTQVAWPLAAQKVFTGNTGRKAGFTFVLERTDENGTPLTGGEAYSDRKTTDASGNVVFDDQNADSVGTFYYRIYEEKPANWEDKNLVYDDTIYRIKVEVTSDDGPLVYTTSVMNADGTWGEYTTGGIKFENHIEIGINKAEKDGPFIAGAGLKVTNSKGATVKEWISSGDSAEIIKDLTVNERYTLTETGVPYGYVQAEPITFYVDTNYDLYVVGASGDTLMENGEITMYDEKATVTISKKDLTSKDELAGAKLVITTTAGTVVVDEWVTDGETNKVINVTDFAVNVVYVLTEKTAPYGYEIAENIYFKIDKDNNILVSDSPNGTFRKATDGVITMLDARKKISISKVDLTNSEELAGANLRITDESGNTVASWTSSSKESKTIEVLDHFEPGKEYTLTEVIAPDGYEVAEDIVFKLDEDGNIWIKGEDGTFTQLGSDTIVMKDAPKKAIGISKVDMTNSEELENASLIVTDSNGNEVDSWITDGSVHKILAEKFEVGEEYTLTEVTAPEGYEIAESITFKLDEDGNIWIKGEDGTFTQLGSDTIVMEDERSKTIGISKVDMTNSEELEGATLIITDSDGNEVDSWVTDGSVHRINTKKFEVDKEYTLTEITAPDGYEVAESITFKLDEDGNIWIKGEDGTFTLLDSDTIVMEDAPTGTSVEKKDPPTTTTITTTTTNTTSAKTGDHTPIAMVVILMLASAVGFIGLVVRRKR